MCKISCGVGNSEQVVKLAPIIMHSRNAFAPWLPPVNLHPTAVGALPVTGRYPAQIPLSEFIANAETGSGLRQSW